jgi:hypothetical protein
VVKFRKTRPVNKKLQRIIDRLVASVARVKSKLSIPVEGIYLYGGFGQNRTLLETLRQSYKSVIPVYNYEHAASIGAVDFGKSRLQSLIFPRMDTGQVLQNTVISPQLTGEEDVKETDIGHPASRIDNGSNISAVSESTNNGGSVSGEYSEDKKETSVNESKEDASPVYYVGIGMLRKSRIEPQFIDLLVKIDFGTTYSGAAFAKKGSRTVIDIKNW